jgi:cytochrome c556
MLRKFVLVFACAVGTTLVLGQVGAEEKAPGIKEIMKTVAGKEGLCAKCNAAAKGENWDDAQKLARSLAECGVKLTKTKCPKGDAESWEKLSKKYCADAAAVSKAAEKKDTKEFAAAIGTFTKSCKGCHEAHK